MKRFGLMGLLLVAGWSHAADWVVLSAEESSRLLIDASSIERDARNEVRFQIKRVHTAQKDMMGLQYNATSGRYVLDCQSGLILFRQQFLLKDDEVVWTFPESGKVQKASLELADVVLAEVCRPPADGSR